MTWTGGLARVRFSIGRRDSVALGAGRGTPERPMTRRVRARLDALPSRNDRIDHSAVGRSEPGPRAGLDTLATLALCAVT